MKTVVIGGHTRNIGKTSVMARLIRELKHLGWTAVKITQYGHGICSLDGEPCGCAPQEHPFELTEERDAAGRGDTCRFLAAGAARSLWLRVRQGQLGDALPLLHQALEPADYVMMESNSILEYIEPTLYLVVLDSTRHDFKSSARQFLERADALVVIESGFDPRAWQLLDHRSFESKPVFPVASDSYWSRKLSRFVREKLRLFDESPGVT